LNDIARAVRSKRFQIVIFKILFSPSLDFIVKHSARLLTQQGKDLENTRCRVLNKHLKWNFNRSRAHNNKNTIWKWTWLLFV